MMEKVNILINDILKNWNPLDVPLEIAEDEYSTYFPMILKHTQNPNSVYSCLKKILKDSMQGVSSFLSNGPQSKSLELWRRRTSIYHMRRYIA